MHSHEIGRHRLVLIGGLFVVALLLGFAVARPFASASIGPDAAAPVIHFQHIVAGKHLESYLGQTPKPLLTLVYGVLYSAAHDWRPVVWGAILAFSTCVVLGGVLAYRVGGIVSGTFVAVALLLSPVLLVDLAFAYAVSWALLAWLVAGLAVTGQRPRYALAGLALAIGTLARLETLIIVILAAACLIAAEILARSTNRPRPPREAWWTLVGFVAIPVMLIHDWLLTGDPLFWAKIAQLNSAAAPNLRGPIQIGGWLVLHLVASAPLVVLAVLGVFILVKKRRWPLALGLLGLGPGAAVFLLYLAARGLLVSPRYVAAIDLSLLVTAGIGLAALDIPMLERWLSRFRVIDRRRLAVLLFVGAVAALGFAPNGPIDGATRKTIAKQLHLHANEKRAIEAIRVELESPSRCLELARSSGVAVQSEVIVPSRLRVQAVVDLDRGLAEVAKAPFITLAAGLPVPGQIVYHDRLDSQTGATWAMYEIDKPVTVGPIRLVPLLADPLHGFWVIRVDSASCPA